MSGEVRLDAIDAGDHGVGGHRRCSVLRSAAPDYPFGMTMTAAALRRPEHDLARCATCSSSGPVAAFGRAFDDPAHGFLLSGRPRRGAPRARRLRRDPRRASARRVHVLEAETRRSGPRLPVRSAARDRPRRDPAPPRQAEPRRRAGRPRGLDRGGRHPDARAHRGARDDRGRRHLLAPAGPVLHRADAADQRQRRLPAGRPGRWRRPRLRRAVLEGPGRARSTS